MLGYVKITVDPEKLKVGASFEETYLFWQILCDVFVKECVEVEIQSWQEENGVIEELEKISDVSKDEGLIKIQRIPLTDANRAFFNNHAANKEGKLKWFSMRFYDENGKGRIEVRDYGFEVRFNKVTGAQSEEVIQQFSNPHTEAVFYDDDVE
ncbi:hypothetical protein MKZ08_04495 [Viridibacillus sp. FSL R5-0477]|uniref:Uncharacterized protein n=1 Tax=Viridibacillus arenosi FSL R5-213 TaxID=1227360 RepID=W4ESB1_9BACL|nr:MULTISPECIES: hypothetical protein [Viridibacillus]ETT82691.1 hypothetical protein C176_16922 [Viridibacillus arenosi FSL R5-213]OMC82334.1 hypothetical protein BK128_20205 [Viridibacillus sp. FSL H7-0596]OMC85648.1 hypothetical protein BK130_02470 [Viridibacillus sp. FSL H8-0123]OMC92237.1 hypothetical protein BK137_04070 [Viridibacillus arenosi]